MASSELASTANAPSPKPSNGTKQKLHGRAFYESIGSPRFVLAPMVDQSEFAWRMLTRSFMTPSHPQSQSLLAYTPMLHARMFAETPKFRASHFLAPIDLPSSRHLDGNPSLDRPLFVQFCANDPKELLDAARYVAPFCDAVDLNLGCPQGIARRGGYGAFLQEDTELIYRLINTLHKELDVPVTAKIRILDTKEKSLEYAKKVVEAGASIVTVHGRTREMKGHKTGVADWGVLRYIREGLGKEVVMFANGNVLRREDIDACLEATGVDGVMSAEGNLYDPAIFAEPPPVGEEGREYWRGVDGEGGWRADAVFRRYMIILYKHVLNVPSPERKPLYMPGDPEPEIEPKVEKEVLTNGGKENGKRQADGMGEAPPAKKQKRDKKEKTQNPNLLAMQPHLFHLLRSLVSKHHNVRDALARARAGDLPAFEHVLSLTEAAVAGGLKEYAATNGQSWIDEKAKDERLRAKEGEDRQLDMEESSTEAVRRCKRPWWVVQAYVRPLPKEALLKGSLTLSKKERVALEAANAAAAKEEVRGKVEVEESGKGEEVLVPKEGLVCG